MTAYPATITVDQEYTIEATMSGLTKNAIYRLRLVLSKSGSSEYFGSTWNESQWYNGTPSPIDYQKFLSITTDSEGSWFGQIKGKIESNDANYRDGAGSYQLKLGRYTENGTSATWSNPATVNLIDLTPTPTPTPTPEPTSTPTPTPGPTSTPTPGPTNTPVPTSTPRPTPTKKPALIATPSGEILGEVSLPAFYPLETTQEPAIDQPNTPSSESKLLPKILLGVGFLFLFSSAFWLWYTRLK